MLRRSGILMCVVGPAGSGKTTLIRRLLEDFGASVSRSISVTSRAPRPGESDGVSYHFVSAEEFRQRADRGESFEWEEVHGNLYGTLRATIDQAIANGIDLLLDIDIRGAMTFKQHYPADTVISFIIPPSPQVLRQRIVDRSAVSTEELQRRLATAQEEYRRVAELQGQGQSIDYYLVNDELAATYVALAGILRAERSRGSRISAQSVAELCRIE